MNRVFKPAARIACAAIAIWAYGGRPGAECLAQAGAGALPWVLASPSPGGGFYQRGGDGFARIPLVVKSREDGKPIDVSGFHVAVQTQDNRQVEGVELRDGEIRGVPAGGPYFIQVNDHQGGGALFERPFFVGDIWLLAGQSNMEGYGDLIDTALPNPHVRLLGMDGAWTEAREPLHWLVDSPDPVHHGDDSTREQRSKDQHAHRTKGAGVGLPFAHGLTDALNIPIGLVACAHGGTSMAQWDPAKKDEGGKSLYGSMVRQFELAGGKVTGVLWYQGESDANPEAAAKYPKAMDDFIAAVRRDFRSPELPFYLVQIGRFAIAGDSKHWNAVQEVQRLIPDKIPHTGVVSAIDLELDDGIHVGTQGHKRLGRRLSNLALRNVYGHAGGSTPTFDAIMRDKDAIIIKFKGVNLISEENRLLGLQPARHIAGFTIKGPDHADLPIIYEAKVGPGPDCVTLKINGKIPEGAVLWYGGSFNPYCNLTDHWDMAAPAFGPVPLDPPQTK